MNITPLEQLNTTDLAISGTQGHPHAKSRQLINLVVTEIAQISLDMPVIFVKDGNTGQFRCVALLGLEQNQNLMFNQPRWHSHSIPKHIQREPFCIGPIDQQRNTLGPCIDLDSDYVTTQSEGTALFTELREKTEFLKRVEEFLATLFEEERLTQEFINTIVELGLLREISVECQPQQGDNRSLSGLFIIDEERLRQFDADTVKRLMDQGFLNPIFASLNSLGQLNRLTALFNQQSESTLVQTTVQLK
ncbi:SapC family protein [Pseudomaricurvus alkylphenolicus]|uniref:SapC family protein n=1 Tax=Pseudomaricurvus alkylphenolicus TaxID=1306991 RepID=UPI00141E2090|nr:SapC family protein [Pseudomaricurvus alkylphenolicus]NIB44197.1 SapC family protein [Pseudomaricurvus alkylphenolicus]